MHLLNADNRDVFPQLFLPMIRESSFSQFILVCFSNLKLLMSILEIFHKFNLISHFILTSLIYNP